MADSTRRGRTSRDCHGLTEPKGVGLAAKSSLSQLGHRGNLYRLLVRVRRLVYLGHKDSQTSSLECELPFGTRGAFLPTLLLGPGGPTAGILLLRPLEAMVLTDNGQLGYKLSLLQSFYPSYFFAWKRSTDNRGIDVQRHSDLS